MQSIFDRIYTQFARLKEKYQSDIDLSFNNGASEQDFIELEKFLGFALPNDFKEIYRIHNGSNSSYMLAGDDWLSIEGIINEYKFWQEIDDDFGCESDNPAIKSDVVFNRKWIPFTNNGSSDIKMIDFDPSEFGVKGQIIQMYYDDASCQLLTNSLKDFFEQFASDLEDDEYVIHPNYICIMSKRELSDVELAQLQNFS